MESSRALSRACRSLTLVVATAALALGISGAAMAASTSLTGTTVSFGGGPGEFNNVVAGYDAASSGGPYIVVQDTDRSTIDNVAGTNCTNTDPTTSTFDGSTVWCPATGVTQLVLNGNDGDDSLSNGPVNPFTGGNSAGPFFPSSVGFLFDGGDGNDVVTLPTGTLTAATGPTGTAFGGNGNDSLTVVDGETANGGAGDDTLNAGGTFTGEKRPFGGSILNGDAGQDQLNGPGAITADQMSGGDGDDVFFPGAGPENMSGGNGNDTVAWGSLGAGPGNGVNASLDNVANDGPNGQNANNHSDIEMLLGTGVTDVLSGAPGVANFVDGFGGNDTFNVASNPADPDVVMCGDGFVTINADAKDVFDTVGPNGCRGQINKPPAASGVTLKVRSSSTKIDSDGEVAIKIGCRGTGTCRGVLQVDKSGTVLGTAQFVIGNGQTKRVSFLPRPAYAKRLKSGKTVKATATVDATDSGGATGSASSTVTIHGKKHKK
jgi:hypothetical protein